MKLCIISRSGQLKTMKHCAELSDFIGGEAYYERIRMNPLRLALPAG